MKKTSKKSVQNYENNEIIKQEINLQFHWYLASFFVIFFGSLIIPAIILMVYVMLFYLPSFLETKSFILLFTQLKPFLASLFMPLIIILCYLIHIFIVGLITRWFWRITERKSPSKTGIIPRNIPSKTLNYYHIRSFMIKYPKNAVIRGPFPWLINFLYNFVGTNKIGKGTTIEEQFGADKFVDIGKNSYIGVNSGFSSHAVEGIFGNIAYAKIKLGDNVTTAALNCLAPGVEINDNSSLFPLAGATKYSTLKGDNYYYGVPLRKIFKKKVSHYAGITEEQLNEADSLFNKSSAKEENKQGE